MKSIFAKLSDIQSQLSVPKSHFNEFSSFHYRNCEDILKALGPILKSLSCSVKLSDEIVAVNTHVYIKATATLIDDSGNEIVSTAWAREAEEAKGMSAPQRTGSCSSYARKYALNGLFAIDDSKDPDSQYNIQPTSIPGDFKIKIKEFTKEENSDTILAQFTANIEAATTSKELTQIGRQISSLQGLTDSDKTALRDLYLKRHAELGKSTS